MSASTIPTMRLVADGLGIEVEPVAAHATIHGGRGARVYVRIRPESAEPGRDAGPRTCMTLTPLAAERFGLLLQNAAHKLYPVGRSGKSAGGAR